MLRQFQCLNHRSEHTVKKRHAACFTVQNAQTCISSARPSSAPPRAARFSAQLGPHAWLSSQLLGLLAPAQFGLLTRCRSSPAANVAPLARLGPTQKLTDGPAIRPILPHVAPRHDPIHPSIHLYRTVECMDREGFEPASAPPNPSLFSLLPFPI